MKKIMLLTAVIAGFFLVACEDDSSNDNSGGGSTTNPCNTILPNKLTARIAGVQWCADTVCFADYAIDMTVFGMMMDGSTMTLELNDVNVGNHPMGTTQNHILFTDNMAMGWESTDDNPGILTIISNDTASNHLKANFSATLRSPLGGNLSLTSGTIDVYYTE